MPKTLNRDEFFGEDDRSPFFDFGERDWSPAPPERTDYSSSETFQRSLGTGALKLGGFFPGERSLN